MNLYGVHEDDGWKYEKHCDKAAPYDVDNWGDSWQRPIIVNNIIKISWWKDFLSLHVITHRQLWLRKIREVIRIDETFISYLSRHIHDRGLHLKRGRNKGSKVIVELSLRKLIGHYEIGIHHLFECGITIKPSTCWYQRYNDNEAHYHKDDILLNLGF